MKGKVKSLVLGLVLAGVVLSGGNAQADTAVVNALVQRTLVAADGLWGGCMALLTVDPRDQLPACGSGWVTFSCSGVYAEKDIAYRMFDQAQLAVATGKRVLVVVDDTKRHNGYCFTKRIDVLR